MAETKATPRPWVWESRHESLVGADGKMVRVYGLGIAFSGLPDGTNDANARLIVQAVNSHDALVDALEDVEWANGGFCPQCAQGRVAGHQPKCLIGCALALAKQEAK